MSKWIKYVVIFEAIRKPFEMKVRCWVFFFLFNFWAFQAQEGFRLLPQQTRIEIPFQLINNLIFIPISVNGVVLNFLLDTGVEETILFSLDDKKELNLLNVDKVMLRGLGSDEAIEGLKSTNNRLFVNGFLAEKQLLYIILDQKFNLSSHIGILVNGIIGAPFFKNGLIEMDYIKKKIFVTKPNVKYQRALEKKFTRIPISIENAKPYFISKVKIDSTLRDSKMLIDLGNSDAIWVFQENTHNIKVPSKHFDDFLGKGFSGDIEGKRAKIRALQMATFEFKAPIVAFPDASSLKHVKMVANRVGSVGAEIFRRFKVVFDYQNGQMYLKKNANFNSHFKYNRTGIEIEQNGLRWVEDYVKLESTLLNPRSAIDPEPRNVLIRNSYKYKFELKPNYFISNIRKKSVAEKTGLQVGDEIISIDGTSVFKYSLQKINSLFRAEEQQQMTVVVLRDQTELKFSFTLENEL